MKLVIWFVVIILVFLSGVSLYCYGRKKVSLSNNNDLKNATTKKCVISIIAFANDIIFFTLKIVGYIPSHCIRKFIYKYIYHMDLGKRVVIYYGFEARSPWNIKIDENSIIGDHAIFDARCGITIGKNVNLSNGVWIWTLQHNINSKSFGTENKGGAVVIKDRAWISSRVSILPQSIIEEGTVIAAGAVFTGGKAPNYTVWGGVPAKEIGRRSDDLDYEFDGKHRFFI